MKRSRLKPRSKTNSRPWENLGLRRQYMDENPICELSEILGYGRREPACDPHHLFGGSRGRVDCVSNLLAVSRKAHLWAEQYKTDGRVIGVWVKLVRKQELRADEFTRSSGYQSVGGWLCVVDANELLPETLPFYRELVSLTAMGTD